MGGPFAGVEVGLGTAATGEVAAGVLAAAGEGVDSGVVMGVSSCVGRGVTAGVAFGVYAASGAGDGAPSSSAGVIFMQPLRIIIASKTVKNKFVSFMVNPSFVLILHYVVAKYESTSFYRCNFFL